ncbi:MAG: patatin-like phospholipase family protein [Candidatus Cloacimonetes bacterium]|nr:patatin-like phospholipase family protein [Candidatus Cloacimonadota bacterium]
MTKKLYLFLALILSFISLKSGENHKTALVLSGGGAKGFAQIGMLKVLDELDIQVDLIIGTSIGAVVGGLYASGHTAEQIEDLMLRIDWNDILEDNLSRKQLYAQQKRWLPMSNITLGLTDRFYPSLPQGLVAVNDIHLRLFYETWQVSHISDFDDLPIAFRCVATDLETGELVLLNSGSIADVMRASSSIPGIFLPIEVGGRLLIDGGVTQNLPADIAHDLGSDFIIAFKTNTELNSRENLKNPIQILNQTLNIGQLYRQSNSEQFADIVITPNTSQTGLLDFSSARGIIEIGYQEAKNYVEILQSQNLPRKVRKEVEKLPDYIEFAKIEIRNNKHLSSAAIRDYLRLQKDTPYNRDDVLEGLHRAFSTELFDIIYPQIAKENEGYILYINVKEKDRNHLSANFVYNQHDMLVLGIILNMRNVVMKNSDLFVNVNVGGVNALDIDYSKYIMYNVPVYYRVFPYMRQDKVFQYNIDFEKERSYKINEYGATVGLGVHLLKHASFEPFLYYYNIAFRHDVGEPETFDKAFFSSGVGAKFYYEYLDDYPYYTRGLSVFSKFTAAPATEVTDEGYKKMINSFSTAIPITKKTSFLTSAEYGTYFKSTPVKEDPFYIGGINNFIGLNEKELSAPFYRTLSAGFRINPHKQFFVDVNGNYLTYGKTDKWLEMDEQVTSIGLVLGYSKVFRAPIPLRLGMSLNDNSRFFTYISVGYDHDPFFFSRR